MKLLDQANMELPVGPPACIVRFGAGSSEQPYRGNRKFFAGRAGSSGRMKLLDQPNMERIGKPKAYPHGCADGLQSPVRVSQASEVRRNIEHEHFSPVTAGCPVG